MSPYTQAYKIILPHHPFPSVIFRSVPIRRLAASIDLSVLSIPSAARDTTPLSCSRVLENFCELALSALAILRIDSESASCSARWWSRIASAVAVDDAGPEAEDFMVLERREAKRAARAVAVVVAEGESGRAGPRERRVCVVVVPASGGECVCGAGDGSVADRAGAVGASDGSLGTADTGGGRSGISGSSSSSSGVLSVGISVDRESMLSLGVGMISARTSSPSELFSSSSSCNCCAGVSNDPWKFAVPLRLEGVKESAPVRDHASCPPAFREVRVYGSGLPAYLASERAA